MATLDELRQRAAAAASAVYGNRGGQPRPASRRLKDGTVLTAAGTRTFSAFMRQEEGQWVIESAHCPRGLKVLQAVLPAIHEDALEGEPIIDVDSWEAPGLPAIRISGVRQSTRSPELYVVGMSISPPDKQLPAEGLVGRVKSYASGAKKKVRAKLEVPDEVAARLVEAAQEAADRRAEQLELHADDQQTESEIAGEL